MAADDITTPPAAGQFPPRRPALFPRKHRRSSWIGPLILMASYIAGLFVAHLAKPILPDLTLYAYAVADVGGLAFLLRYVRTDWNSHPWGRHVMAFMLCLEALFTLALSRRIFGDWPGLEEALFLGSCTFAGIVWWRYRLQALGDRRARDAQSGD